MRFASYRVSGLDKPSRNVTLALQQTPDVDGLGAFEVKKQVGEARRRPDPQTRQVQLVCIARRPRSRPATKLRESLLDCLDEAQRHLRSAFRAAEVDGLADIAAGCLSRNDSLGFHRTARCLTGLRREVKYAASASADGLDIPPLSRSRRSCDRSCSLRINSRTYSLLVPKPRALNLLVDERLELIRKRDVHRAHDGIIAIWQISAMDRNTF